MVTATPILSLDCFACPQDIAEAASTITSTTVETIETDLASLFATAVHPLPAVVTATREFKKVSLDFKVGVTGQPLLQIAEVAIGEVSYCAAIRANQVVVVF
jgi:hypothetical protein